MTREASRLDLRHVRATVTDARVLAQLTLDAIAAYLQRTGWTQRAVRQTSTVWERGGEEAGRRGVVLTPNDESYADYPVRVGEVLAALAEIEERSQLAVLAELFEGSGGSRLRDGGHGVRLPGLAQQCRMRFWTPADLARAAGITWATASTALAGGEISIATAKKIEAALEASPPSQTALKLLETERAQGVAS